MDDVLDGQLVTPHAGLAVSPHEFVTGRGTATEHEAMMDRNAGTGRGAILQRDAGPRHGAIVPRVGVTVRAGTLADLAFIDRLQKAHSRELGFLPTMALEGKIRLGQVLVAETFVDCGMSFVGKNDPAASDVRQSTHDKQQTPTPVGYLIAADRYCRRDEVGYVTQINVLPEYRRSLVAAALLQAQFDRSAYGCRLYCCWCAQDLKANKFWEAMGFTPIAFRTGSRTKGAKSTPRIHLFWQKRVRADDTGDASRGGTAWWYPAKTEGGEMREDRLVFPIPPGVHWRDVLPVVLPETANAGIDRTATNGSPALPGATVCGTPQAVRADEDTALNTKPCPPASMNGTGGDACRAGFNPPSDEVADSRRDESRPTETALAVAKRGRKTKAIAAVPLTAEQIAELQAERAAAREAIRVQVREHPPRAVRPAHVPRGALWAAPDWDDYQPTDAEIDAEVASRRAAVAKTRKRTAKQAATIERKVDPRLIEMSRELRDRWSEQAAAIAALPGKHDVRRAITGPIMAGLPTATARATPLRALPAAA